MNKIIQRIEADIEYWKTKSEADINLGLSELAEREIHIVVGLVLALNHVKELSGMERD